MLQVDVQWQGGRLPIRGAFHLHMPAAGLTGPSASGKSCLLRLLAGRIMPDRGRIVLDGKVLFDSRRGIRRLPDAGRIALAEADDQLDNGKTVRENLEPGAAARAVHGFSFDEIVDLLELEPLLGFRASHLSSGERQRVVLGRALRSNPRLLLLDNTLASLEENLRSKVLGWLHYSRKERGLDVIYASSRLGDLLRLSDFLILMEHGCVRHAGYLTHLIAEQTLPPLAESAMDNVLPVTVLLHDVTDGCTLARFFGIRLALPYLPQARPGSIGYVGVRSSDIALALRPLPDISVQNQIKGRVCAVIPRTDRVLVQMDAGSILRAEITRRAQASLSLQEGDTVYGFIKTHNFTWLLRDAQLHRAHDRRSLSTASEHADRPTPTSLP